MSVKPWNFSGNGLNDLVKNVNPSTFNVSSPVLERINLPSRPTISPISQVLKIW